MTAPDQKADVLILTAADIEPVGVRQVCEPGGPDWKEQEEMEGYPIWTNVFTGKNGKPFTVALSIAEDMGEVECMRAAETLASRLQPSCIAMSGICAGRPKKTKLRDVIFSSLAWNYDKGAEICDADPESEVLEQHETVTHCIEDGWARQLKGFERKVKDFAAKFTLPPDASWNGGKALRVQVGPMATGAKLMKNAKKWEMLAEINRKVLALDMEAAAVGLYAKKKGLCFLVVKAVVDHADPRKGDRHHAFSARAAAEVLIAFLKKYFDSETGLGTGVAVAAGGSVLPDPEGILSENTQDLPAEPGPAQLVNAVYEAVAFDEGLRKREIASLEQWVSEPNAARVRLFHGPGGTGKTRLFIEFCERMRKKGWLAGFLNRGAGPDEVRALLQSGKNVLAVVDYAEAWPGLEDVLKALAESEPGEKLFRLAFLTRQAGDWWKETERKLEEMRLPAGLPMLLSPISPEDGDADREEFFFRAARAYSEILGKDFPDKAPDLSHERFGRALYVQMAALLAVLGDEIDPDTVLEKVLNREKKFWVQKFREGNELSAEQEGDFVAAASRMAAAAALLAGVQTQKQAAKLLKDVEGPPQKGFLRFFHTLYPGKEKRFLGPLEPDLLAEHLVGEVLQEHFTEEDFAEKVFAGQPGERITQGLVFLARVAEHPNYVDTAFAAMKQVLLADLEGRALPGLYAVISASKQQPITPLGGALHEALEEKGTPEIAIIIVPRLPEYSVSLVHTAAWTTQEMAEHVRKGAEEDSELRPVLAGLLNNLGVRLSQAGKEKKALEAIQKAVEIRRKLAQDSSDAYMPDLAMSLSNLGIHLSKAGRREEALAAEQEAVEIRRRLVKKSPVDHLLGLAASLHNLGNRLSDTGKKPEALVAAQEAVDICRKLAQASPAAYLPGLARCLTNLGIRLADAGRRPEALAATQESVDIRRKLAQESPAAYMPDLATSLNNLGVYLYQAGRREEGLATARESVAITLPLVRQIPIAFIDDLEVRFSNLVKGIIENGLSPEEDETVTEARAVLAEHGWRPKGKGEKG